MRLLYTIIIILLSTSLLADELLIVDSEIAEYPNRSVKMYQFDEGSKSALNSLINSDINLTFNNDAISNISLLPSGIDNYTPLTIVFSIDVSGNSIEYQETIINSINKVFRYLAPYQHSYAIQTYNSRSYLLQDITNDYNRKDRALNMLAPFGVSNYNTGFLDNTTGSIAIANSSANKPIIININTGNGFGDANSITNDANQNSVPIYNFSIEKNPVVLNSISNNTDAKSYSNLDEDGLFRFILYSILNESNITPYSINYTKESCDLTAIIKVEKTNGLENDEYEFEVDPSKLPFIEVNPNFIDFGIIDAGSSELESFTLTARNSDILLEDIIFPNNINITPEFEDVLLEKNSPKAFNISLFAQDTTYNYQLIELISKSCNASVLEVFSGSKSGDNVTTNLRVEYPNGGEEFNQGESVNIRWSGVLDQQEIILEYSDDNGTNWNLITDSATNKQHTWFAPNIESNNMLMKASIPNGDISFSGIDYLSSASNSSDIIQVDLSRDKSLAALSYENGGIILWDLVNKEQYRILRNENPGIENLDISFGYSSNLFAAAFGKEDEFNVVVWDPDNDANTQFQNFVDKPNVIEWSSNPSILLIGFESGELIEWDLSKSNDELTLIKNFFKPLNDIDISRSNNNIAIASSQSVYVANGQYNLIDSLAFLGISNVKWNGSGSKFLAAYNFNDLRLYNFNNSNITNGGRINRTDDENIIEADWIDNSNILISTKNNYLESWNTDDTPNLNYSVHELPLNSFELEGPNIISSDESNTALYWDLNDYPFDFSVIDTDVSDANWSIVSNDLQYKELDYSFCIGNEYLEKIEDAITNDGSTLVVIDSIKSDYPLFNVLNQFPIELNPSESADFTFSFAPVDIGNFVNEFFIYRGGRIDTLLISYENTLIRLEEQVDKIEFESTIINLTNTQTFNIFTNSDNKTITFDTLEILIGDDVFEYLSGNYEEIDPGESLELTMRFAPTEEETYSGLIKLSSPDVCFPYYVSILGKGIDSDIRVTEAIEFGNIGCDATADATVMLYNLSDADFTIESIDFNDAIHFNSSTGTPVNLKANDSTAISVQFSPIDIGSFEDTLNIGTNLSGNDSLIKIALSGTRDTTNIEFVDKPLDFGTIRPNTSEVKQGRIVNNSLSDLELEVPIDLGLFELIAANPETVAPGDTALLSFRFKGYENDTSFTTDFPIMQGCESVFEQELSINVSNGPSIIEVVDELDLGIWNCSDSLTGQINIKNTGESNLILTDLYFETGQASQFQLNQDYKNTSILTDNTINIDFTYFPDGIGDITTNLVVESNASNAVNGRSEIAISVEQNNIDFSLSADSLIFDGLKINTAYKQSIKIYNDGNTEAQFSFTNGSQFIINSATPITIPAQDSVEFEVEFIGGDKDNTYSEQIEFTNECSQINTLTLIANVVGDDFITLQLDSYELKTGTEFNLDISYINSTGVAITGDDTLTTTLSFNSTVMVPRTDEYESSIDSSGNRKMTLVFPITTSTLLASIPMVTTLGNSESTEISFSQTTHLSNDYFIEDTARGKLTITNIDTIPTNRLIDGSKRSYMSEPIPNPVVDESEIKYGIIENTPVTIDLYDLEGKILMNLVDRTHTPGDYTLKIDSQNLSSGNYLCVLRTESIEIITKLTVVR
ncbi:MAG: choice-of-anchor D domain-containing protein [Chlorobiota bacterium]